MELIIVISLIIIILYFVYNRLLTTQHQTEDCKNNKNIVLENPVKPNDMGDIRVIFHEDKVKLLWDPVVNADKYEIYGGYKNICKPRIHTTNETSWTTDQKDSYIIIFPINDHGSGSGNAEDIHIIREE
jgi:hypothetical protein